MHLPNCGGNLVYPSKLANWKTIKEIAVGAEKLGYESVWVNDHLSSIKSIHGRSRPRFFEPLTTLAALGMIARKIKLGTAVVVLPWREPLVVAKQAACVNEFSDGRLILGVGFGRFSEEFEILKVDFKARGAMLDEGLSLLSELLKGGRVSFSGKFYACSDAQLSPSPSRVTCPVWVGGNAPASLRRAARFCDGWLPGHTTPEDIAEAKRALGRMLRKVGRPADSVEIASENIVAIARSKNVARRKFETFPYARGISYATNLAARAFVGTAQEVLDRLRKYSRAGLQHVVVIFADQDANELLDSMQLFSDEVMSALSGGN